MEAQCEAFCNEQWVGIAGCAGSSKTTSAVVYGFFWWLCGMSDSAVVLTSTTKGDIRKRAWYWVQKLYTSIQGPRIGHMVDSQMMLQGVKADGRHCICAIPVREGSTAKAVARIQGYHPDRLLIIIDEATDTPEAIFDSFPNLISTPWDFQVITLGNPNSKFDPFGKFCEPKDGWNSVNVETDEWETIPQLNMKPGKVLHFDAERSPNILTGSVQYRHLPHLQRLEAMRKRLGENSPQFYKFWRGFWCPEGIIQTVLTESLLSMTKSVGAMSKHIFTGGLVFNIAGLDPAFNGGDRAVLRFAKVGVLENGSLGIQLTDREQLNISAKSDVPIHYQIVQQVKWHCSERGVTPDRFGLDSTGEGGGLADIFSREWGSDVNRIEFGGKPSDDRVSNEDDRMACEVYDRRVTELHFTIKELVTAGQLRGVNAREASDVCNRLWRMKGRKIEIEPKTKRKTSGDAEESSNFGFKERMGRSPDDGDALAVLCATAKRCGVTVKLQGKTSIAADNWMAQARKFDSVYTDDPVGDSDPEPTVKFDDFELESI